MLAVGIYALANPHSLVGDFITSAIPIVFIVIGALLFALTTIGLIWLSYSRGGTREQLRNDVVGMGLLCLLLTLILILTLAYEYRALHIIDSTWSQYFRNDWDRLENIQRRFQCCGFNSLLDRDVPRLSPVSTFHFRVQSYGSNVNTAFSPDFQEQDVKRCAESKEFGYHQPCAPQLATRFHHDMFPLTAVILITLALAVPLTPSNLTRSHSVNGIGSVVDVFDMDDDEVTAKLASPRSSSGRTPASHWSNTCRSLPSLPSWPA